MNVRVYFDVSRFLRLVGTLLLQVKPDFDLLPVLLMLHGSLFVLLAKLLLCLATNFDAKCVDV